MPKVSIVMPTYNMAEFIKEAVDSVLYQMYTDWELIIVDDGSVDQTKEVLEPIIKKEDRVHYSFKENGGTGSALNHGFQKASGQYLTWIAADNILYPNYLDVMVEYLDTHSECSFVFTAYDYAYWDKQQNQISVLDSEKRRLTVPWEKGKLLRDSYYLGISWLWRKGLHEKLGEFQLEPCEDYDWALRAEESGYELHYIPEKTAWYRQHDKNLTNLFRRNGDGARYERQMKEKAYKRQNKYLEKNIMPLNGKMGIAIINLEFDCAGVGWDLREAINQYTKHDAIHIAKQTFPFAPKTDFKIDPNNLNTFEELLKKSDVLHFNQWIWTHNPFIEKNPYLFEARSSQKPLIDWDSILKNKRVFFHFHAGEVLAAPDYWIKECNRVGARMFCCSPPTEEIIPEAKWIPNVLDIWKINPIERPFEYFHPLNVFIGHGLDDQRKTSQVFKNHLDAMKRNGIALNINHIWGVPKEESFIKRKPNHITLESLVEGYIGMVGWEALAMGQIVISRLSPTSRLAYDSIGLDCPILMADSIQEVASLVRDLNLDRLRLYKLMRQSREWMERNYKPDDIVKLYVKEYEA